MLNNCQQAFDKLKKVFTIASILAHFDWDKKILVETDASDLTSAGVLSQYDNDNILSPVVFCLKLYSPTEPNYEIHNKELMAIVHALEE